MKKIVITVLSACLLSSFAIAQSVSMGPATFNKEQKPGFTMELSYSKKVVEEAVENHFKKSKLKGKSASGMTEYAKVNYNEMCVNGTTIYTKVEGSSKQATLTIFAMRDNGNFISGTDEETPCIVKFMQETIANDVRALDLQYKIEEQTKECTKAQKEYEKLLDEKSKIEKEILDADKNRQKQNELLKQLESQKK